MKANSDLNDSLALKHVIDAGQLSNTFLVLSKSEEVTHSNQEQQILSRLLETSRDNPLLHELPACVATADFTTKYYSLHTAAAEEEQHVFEQFIAEHINGLESVSRDGQFVTQRAKELRCMLSNEALVVTLAGKMQDYIVQQWKPKSKQVWHPWRSALRRTSSNTWASQWKISHLRAYLRSSTNR